MAIILICSCTSENKKEKQDAGNPFLSEYNTSYNVPPFDKIKTEHYLPAIREAIKKQKKEIDDIIGNKEEPDFKNTVEAFSLSGYLLNEVLGVFNNIRESNTNDTLQKLAKEIAPMVSLHQDKIIMNAGLFKKIKTVYDKRESLKLGAEQNRLLEETYDKFIRGGAGLNDKQKKRMSNINQELSVLSLKFGDHILAENNFFKLVIDKKEDLAGLPKALIDGATDAAKEAKMENKWVFTLHAPSIFPFLQYSEKRELREKILKAYLNRCNNNDANDNKEIIKKILNLKTEKAKMLGYKNYSELVLAKNMAKNPEAVYNLLKQVWEPALKMGKKEAAELQAMITKEGGKFKLEPWDWRYYAEKLRKEKYDLDEEQLRPYFELENVKTGLFTVANKLYGIKLIPKNDIPKYHKDAVSYEVQDKDGSYLGVLYMDFYPRASKRGGAWMSNYREQQVRNGKDVRPVVTVVCNFSKPTAEQPALLTYEEVSTMFHEFGHALHGLLSKCTYIDLSGSSVTRDFVELPSQIMENWVEEPEALKIMAKHYKTGEVIPDALVDKIKKSRKYGQGFATTEFIAAALLDMDYHTITEPLSMSIPDFETKTLKAIGLIPEIPVRYRSTYFNHIFGGGYSSGYYSYTWAEVLDADAFDAFKKNGIFDQKTALSFRTYILEKGNTEDPMILYKRFRGSEPDIKPLLKRRGLL